MPPSPYGANPSLADLVAMLYASQGQAAPIGGGDLQSTFGKSVDPPLGDVPGGRTPQSSHPVPGEGTIGGGIPMDGGQFTPQGGPAGRLGVGTTSGGAPGGGNGGGGGLPIPGAGGSGAGAGIPVDWTAPYVGGATTGGAGAGAGAAGAGVAGGVAGAGGAAGGVAGAGGLAGLLGNVNWGRLALVAAALLGGSQTGKPPAGGSTTAPRRGGGGGGGGGSKVPLAPPVPYQGIQHNSSFVGYQPIQPFTTGGGPTNFVPGAGSSTPARPTPSPPPAAKPEGKRPPRGNSNPRPNRPTGPANGPQNRTPNTEPTPQSQDAMMQFLMSLIQADPSLLQGVGGQSQGGP